MSVENDIVFFFVAQSLIIVMALVGAYVGLRVQIAKLEINDEHFMHEVTDLKQGHSKINDKVDGISRSVAKLHGALSRTLEEKT